MRRKLRLVHRTLRRPGRIVPVTAARLHGRVVILGPGQIMAWHSTGRREEVVMMISGTVRLEVREDARGKRVSAISPTADAVAVVASDLRRSQCVFLPQQTVHRLVNRSRRPARYLYVTG